MIRTGQYQYSTGSSERTGSFRGLLLLLFVVATLVPVSIISWQLRQSAKPISASAASTPLPSAWPWNGPNVRQVLVAAALPARPLFPYSVIPGGATSAEELKTALASDPVAAAHYSDFDPARAHVVRLEHARAVYVSYRLRNHIYWTSHTVNLPGGEAIITDGDHEARTRCGNRISSVPRAPVALVEPETAVLDTPAPEIAALPAEYAGDLPFPLAAVPVGPAPSGGGGIYIPPILPIGGGGGGGSGPSKPPVPPVSTPEPGTLLLVSAGLSSTWLVRKRSSAR